MDSTYRRKTGSRVVLEGWVGSGAVLLEADSGGSFASSVTCELLNCSVPSVK